MAAPEEEAGREPEEFSLREMQARKRRPWGGGGPHDRRSTDRMASAPGFERVDLRHYADLLTRRKGTVLMVSLMVLGSSVVLSLRLPDVHRAVVKIALRPEAESSAGANPLIPFSQVNMDKVVSQATLKPVFYEAARQLRAGARQVEPLYGKIPDPMLKTLETYFLEGEELVTASERVQVARFAATLLRDLYRDRLARPAGAPAEAQAWLRSEFAVEASAAALLGRSEAAGDLSEDDRAALEAAGLRMLRGIFSVKELQQMRLHDFLKLSPQELRTVQGMDSGSVEEGVTAELSQVAGGEMIYLVCTGTDANLVALRANAVGVAFVARDIGRQQEGGQRIEAALQDMVCTRKADLEAKRAVIQEERRKVAVQGGGGSALPVDIHLLIDQLRESRKEAENSRVRLELARVRASQLQARLAEEPSSEKTQVVFEDFRAKEFAKKEMELAVLLETYREGHPKVHTLKRELETLRKQIAENREKADIPSSFVMGRNPVRDMLVSRLSEAQEEEAGLEQSLPTQEAKLKDLETRLGSLRQHEEIVIRKLADEEAILADAVKAIEENLVQARITKDSTLGILRIDEQAVLPAARVGPNRMQNYVLGLLVGMALGIASAFFLEYLDHTIQTTAELQHVTSLTPMGIIPVARPGQERLSPEDPQTELSEVYGVIRNNIRHGSRQAPERMLLVVSALPGDGKSLACANLAVSYALEGSHTALVNADIRSQTRACTAGMPTSRPMTVGLADFLSRDLPLEEVLYPSMTPGLTILPAGDRVSNPARLLRSERMQKLLKTLEQRFGVVIIDCPAVLPVVDATLISHQARGVLLVVACGQTPIPAVNQCLARLRHVRSPLIGVVLNKVREVPSGHFYYGYGYSSRGVGKGREA